jgi:hypothetical protein
MNSCPIASARAFSNDRLELPAQALPLNVQELRGRHQPAHALVACDSRPLEIPGNAHEREHRGRTAGAAYAGLDGQLLDADRRQPRQRIAGPRRGMQVEQGVAEPCPRPIVEDPVRKIAAPVQLDRAPHGGRNRGLEFRMPLKLGDRCVGNQFRHLESGRSCRSSWYFGFHAPAAAHRRCDQICTLKSPRTRTEKSAGNSRTEPWNCTARVHDGVVRWDGRG